MRLQVSSYVCTRFMGVRGSYSTVSMLQYRVWISPTIVTGIVPLSCIKSTLFPVGKPAMINLSARVSLIAITFIPLLYSLTDGLRSLKVSIIDKMALATCPGWLYCIQCVFMQVCVSMCVCVFYSDCSCQLGYS